MAGPADATGRWAGLHYGAWGFPVAFLALPLYVQLPAHYAQQWGVSLSAMGLLLLAARGFDAVIDPWLGRRVDAWMRQSSRALLQRMGLAGLVMAAGFAALFLAPIQPFDATQRLWWCGLALIPTMLAYSLATISHQGWAAALGGSQATQAQVVGWREACALGGVVTASVLPPWLGWGAMATVLALSLIAGWWLLARAPAPAPAPALAPSPAGALPLASQDGHRPWRHAGFRRLIAVFALNGIASAVPATLVLFFIADRLEAPAWSATFLGSYFLAAAVGLPAWVRLVPRWGLVCVWAVGMVLATATFALAWSIDRGDTWGFLAVCVASGLALGADLAVPSALLAVTLPPGHASGTYFGWWNCVAKLNLALAAGLALPLLAWYGYAPGLRTDSAVQALRLAYCVLPCLLKLAALLALWHFARLTPIRR